MDTPPHHGESGRESGSNSSYYAAAAELRKETLWQRSAKFWKRQRESPWFWAAEVGVGVVAAFVAEDGSGLYQAVLAGICIVGLAFLIWLTGIVAAPYLWRHDARKLLPPFDDRHQRTQQKLMHLRIVDPPRGHDGDVSPEERGIGTAFEALLQVYSRLAIGVTVQECAKLLSETYGDGSTPTKQDRTAVQDAFLAELSMLHVVRRDGDRFCLTEFGKDFLDRHILHDELDIAEDGTLFLRKDIWAS